MDHTTASHTIAPDAANTSGDTTVIADLPRLRGWYRRGNPRTGFWYENAKGQAIRSPAHLKRIEQLHIPPGWRDVRISPSHTANLQATGFDAKGRKQYIYHPDFVARQARKKFERLATFAHALPRMREVTNAHLHLEGLPKEKVLAAVVRLINETYFRVGSQRYAKHHRTFGATSLRKRHCRIEGRRIIFTFRGKRAVVHRRIVTDEVLICVVTDLLQLPGKQLFQYQTEDGTVQSVSERMLNAYLKEVLHPACSAKDFRTFGGSLLAAQILAELGPPESARDAKKKLTTCVRRVAERLGNTPAVTRSSYIHPVVFELFEQGKTLNDVQKVRRYRRVISRQSGHTPEEAAFLQLLEIEARVQMATSAGEVGERSARNAPKASADSGREK
ncbi:MAG: DNA topoisomerase IB [Pseudomonadota bacterium]